MKKILNNVTAIVMMGLVFLSPLPSSALAASKGRPHKPVRQERQIQRHEISRVPVHRHDDHDDSGALVGGLILGVILGVAIANVNAN